MKWQKIMRTSQIRRFAPFLEEHPGFWPELVGEDAFVCGFHVGGCFLSLQDMEKLIAAQSCVEAPIAGARQTASSEREER